MEPISHSFYSYTLLNSSKLSNAMYNTYTLKTQHRISVHISSMKKKVFESVSFLSYIQRGTLKIQYLPLYNDLWTQTSSLGCSKCKGSYKYALETVLTPTIQCQSLYHFFIYVFSYNFYHLLQIQYLFFIMINM